MTPADRNMFALLVVGITCLAVGFFMVSARFGFIGLGLALTATAWKAMHHPRH